MESILVPTGIVALAEIGDKTQLLAFVLAARFKRPLPIILGIILATLLNHSLAGALGGLAIAWLGPNVLGWILGLSFIAMAIWTLVPDKIDDDTSRSSFQLGVFGTTFLTFFLVEMGDKTQVATVALAAHYHAPVIVVIGTTIGMLIADVPAVFLGDRFAARLPVKLIHTIAAAVFAVLGVVTLVGVIKGISL